MRFNHRFCGARMRSRRRRGISLLEVLVSMFIMLFGLMGVASLFPVGSYHTAKAIKYERAAAVGQRAFQEIKIRGLLRPDRWNNSSGQRISDLTNWQSIPVGFDPIGITSTSAPLFPTTSSNGGLAPLTRANWRNVTTGGPAAVPSSNSSAAVANYIFRSRDDLVVEFPTKRSLPGVQRINAAEREFSGDYHWGFTATPIPNYGEGYYLVSVLVFYKSDPTHEWMATSIVTGTASGTARIKVTADSNDQLSKLNVGGWILLVNANDRFIRWYEIVGKGGLSDLSSTSTGQETQIQVRGQGWPNWLPAAALPNYVGNSAKSTGAQVPKFYCLSEVVAVYEQVMKVDPGVDWGVN